MFATVAVAAVATDGGAPTLHNNGESQPSFLFILGDDIGWADFSYNNGTARTPFIDAWTKREGTIKLQDFHSAGTICSPTRASVLTGRNPWRDCVSGVYGCSDMTECVPHFPFAPRRTFTIADAARKAGLGHTSQFWGKWHLGSFYNDSEKFGGFTSSPVTHGFDHFNATVEVAPTATTNCLCRKDWAETCDFGHNKKATHCQGGCCFNYWWEDPDKPHGVANLTNLIGEDDSAYIADSFERFVRGLQGSPFLAQLSFHNCHMPYIGAHEAREACKAGEACAPHDGHGHQAADFSDAQLDFYACLSELDASVGRVLAVLEEQHYYENTLIWFTTDNGPEGNCPNGRCAPNHVKVFPGDAGPLRGRKRDVWEGGHRVPGVVSWPRVVQGPARESWDLVLTSDFLPTVMDALGVERPSEQEDWGMDGTSILPLLRGEALAERGVGWLYGNDWAMEWPPKSMAFRLGPWKYINRSKSCEEANCKHELLYNLDSDLSEETDLSSSSPSKLRHLREMAVAWRETVEQSRLQESLCAQFATPSRGEAVRAVQFI